MRNLKIIAGPQSMTVRMGQHQATDVPLSQSDGPEQIHTKANALVHEISKIVSFDAWTKQLQAARKERLSAEVRQAYPNAPAGMVAAFLRANNAPVD